MGLPCPATRSTNWSARASGRPDEEHTVLASCRALTPDAAETLLALLDEDDHLTRPEAAYGLALRDDPRTAEAIGRIGHESFADDHRWCTLWRRRYDKEHPAAG
ncbi:hypothetical protein ADK41_25475 [Streptomyces caelestis]|uniref:HEAT repeat domain-containing protein n=2 Tax=Streptomyces TaxID=1883 RepID=A0A0N0S5N9_9ACTN|nr:MULTISPECIES: hypothetical protein [Streptomyces]KOT35308.1 hypothetical protein ADK41_25475 [Streptomyces caelestis]